VGRLVCVVGPIAAGKTTVCELLAKLGYEIVSVGGILAAECSRAGLAVNRENLQAMGAKLLSDDGTSGLAALLSSQCEGHEAVAIDGLRVPGILARISTAATVRVWYIDAPLNLRVARAMVRDGVSRLEYERMCAMPIESAVQEFRANAHAVIWNDGSLMALSITVTAHACALLQ
jgi:dephospho-CoA kinase